MKQGKFIVLEGVEGAGKTSQCKRLAAALEAKGIDAVLTRSPSGCARSYSIPSIRPTRLPSCICTWRRGASTSIK